MSSRRANSEAAPLQQNVNRVRHVIKVSLHRTLMWLSFLRALTRFRVHFVAQWVKINDILAPKTFVRCKSGIYDSASWGTSNTICRLLSILFRHQVKIRLESLWRYLQDEETTALPWLLSRHCNATVTLFKWWNAVSLRPNLSYPKRLCSLDRSVFAYKRLVQVSKTSTLS